MNYKPDQSAPRINRDRMLMEMAFTVAKRGTCARARVGAVLSRDGRVISTGYNGAPSGITHCHHPHHRVPDKIVIDSEGVRRRSTKVVFVDDSPCKVSEHAERNAIAYAARYGVATDGAILHSTHEPCLDCARMIVNAGIFEVNYVKPYRVHDGLSLLVEAGIVVAQLTYDDLEG